MAVSASFDLMSVKTGVILGGAKLHCRGERLICLDDDAAVCGVTTDPTGGLGDQLKSPLGRAKIGQR